MISKGSRDTEDWSNAENVIFILVKVLVIFVHALLYNMWSCCLYRAL